MFDKKSYRAQIVLKIEFAHIGRVLPTMHDLGQFGDAGSVTGRFGDRGCKCFMRKKLCF